MARFGFGKEHSDYASAGFVVTNEDPEIHIKLLEKYIDPKKPPKKALSICSGGEVPIYVLLPVCKRVFAIDHGARALAAAQVKALWLSQWGPKRLQQFLKDCNQDDSYSNSTDSNFRKVMEAVYPRISKVLRDSLQYKNHTTFRPFGYELNSIRSIWGAMDVDRLAAAKRRLGSLKFLLGDIAKDTKKFGLFDVIYASNCTEHSGRNGSPGLNDFEPLLKPGGLVLYTSGGFRFNHQGLYLSHVGPQAKPVSDIQTYLGCKFRVTHDWNLLESSNSGSWKHSIARFNGTPTKYEEIGLGDNVIKPKAA